MDRAQFRDLLSAPLLADGGMGTTLVEHGAHLEDCFDELNLTRPEIVAAAHRAFVEAGSRLIETNTFGANRFNLEKFGLGDKVRDVNLAGAEIARAASDLVAGSVGPLRVRLAPYGRVRPAEAREAYREQIQALVDGGVDSLFIETQSDLVEVEEAVAAAREVSPDLPVVVTCTFTLDDRTLLGATPEQVTTKLVALDVDALGVNCSEGPAQVLRVVGAMRPHASGRPLVAIPNAGGPARVGNRIMYPATPEYFAEYARAFLTAGVSIVGGCCGTGPAHIRAMAQALSEPRQLKLEVVPAAEPAAEASGQGTSSQLSAKLATGRFVVAVEMDPPRGFSTARLLAGAETLSEAGADVINVADSPMARLRMSPWAACRLIQEHGVETTLHFPTRGRNLLRVQGDLLAAHALGIRNLFVCLGDPTAIGDYPSATDTMDVVPTGLVRLITQSFNRGRDQSGASIGEPTSFFVGAAVNVNAPDLDREIKLTHKKVEAGVNFALSQAVFAPDTLRRFRKAYEERFGPLSLPILAGVLPLVTSRHAEFLHNELPGMSVPDEIRERMRRAGDGAEAEGLRLALELVRELREHAAGIYLMPPFGRYDLAADIVDAVRRG